MKVEHDCQLPKDAPRETRWRCPECGQRWTRQVGDFPGVIQAATWIRGGRILARLLSA